MTPNNHNNNTMLNGTPSSQRRIGMSISFFLEVIKIGEEKTAATAADAFPRR
jgi:hypothetical protein